MVLPLVYRWIGIAFCLTGPVQQAENCCCDNTRTIYDFDRDCDLDLRDVAEFLNRAGEPAEE